MPITIPQLLDLLMALVLLMFIPIGLWRGALREWIALTGILLGWRLQGEWSDQTSWGGDLAALTGLDPHVASFAVAAGFFLGVTLIVGYGGGVMLPYRPNLSWPNRLLGAALGFGNGTLILSGALRIMDGKLFDGQPGSPLRLSGLGAFLISSGGWAELLLLGVMLCALSAGGLRQLLGRSPLLEEYAPTDAMSPGDDDEATSPPSETAWRDSPLATGRRLPHEQETAVLRTIVPPVTGAAEPSPLVAAVAPAGPAAAPPVITVPRPAPRQGATVITPADTPANTPATRPILPVARAAQPNGNGHTADTFPADVPTPTTTCGVCGTTIAERARFCPTCGHIVGAAERRSVARPA